MVLARSFAPMLALLLASAALCLPHQVRAQGTSGLSALSAQSSLLYELPAGFTDLGTYSLRSANEKFGGLSGLYYGGGSDLRAISDRGSWIRFNFDQPLMRLGGEPFALHAPVSIDVEPLDLLSSHQPSTHRRDAESIAWLDRGGSPRLYVSLERDHRVQRHQMDGASELRMPKPLALQGTFGNTGIEALSGLPDTCLFAITEGVKRQGGLRAFKYCGGNAWQTRVYLPTAEGFRPTAADLSPDGAYVYVIERSFARLRGFQARLVRLSVADIDANVPLVPELVLDLSNHMLPTWNIEGLALTVQPAGNLVALMVTDNNFEAYLPNMLIALELPADPF